MLVHFKENPWNLKNANFLLRNVFYTRILHSFRFMVLDTCLNGYTQGAHRDTLSVSATDGGWTNNITESSVWRSYDWFFLSCRDIQGRQLPFWVLNHHVTRHNKHYFFNYWVMHPVARVSINVVYRNLRTQQMSVLVLLCTFYTTCFGPYWWPSSGGL
jgi:hypothetical protein